MAAKKKTFILKIHWLLPVLFLLAAIPAQSYQLILIKNRVGTFSDFSPGNARANRGLAQQPQRFTHVGCPENAVDPQLDPDGRCAAKAAYLTSVLSPEVKMAFNAAMKGVQDYNAAAYGSNPELYGVMGAVNGSAFNPVTPFFNLAGGRDIISARDFTWWGDWSENIGQAGLNLIGAGSLLKGGITTEIQAGLNSEISNVAKTLVTLGEDFAKAEGITVWRNVPAGHGALADAQAGIVKPFGETLDMSFINRVEMHDGGFTEGSGLTSWSADLQWAQARQARLGGVLLQTQAPAESIWFNQAAKGAESQVLIPGEINATILK